MKYLFVCVCLFGCSFIRDFDIDFVDAGAVDARLDGSRDGDIADGNTDSGDSDLPDSDNPDTNVPDGNGEVSFTSTSPSKVLVTEETFALQLEFPVPPTNYEVLIAGQSIELSAAEVVGNSLSIPAVPMDARHYWGTRDVVAIVGSQRYVGTIEFCGAPRAFVVGEIGDLPGTFSNQVQVTNLEAGDLDGDTITDAIATVDGRVVRIMQRGDGFDITVLEAGLDDIHALGLQLDGNGTVSEIQVGHGNTVNRYTNGAQWERSGSVSPPTDGEVEQRRVMGIHHVGGGTWMHVLRDRVRTIDNMGNQVGVRFYGNGGDCPDPSCVAFNVRGDLRNNAGVLIDTDLSDGNGEQPILVVPFEENTPIDGSRSGGMYFYPFSTSSTVRLISFREGDLEGIGSLTIAMAGFKNEVASTAFGAASKPVNFTKAPGANQVRQLQHPNGSRDIESADFDGDGRDDLVMCGGEGPNAPHLFKTAFSSVTLGVWDEALYARDQQTCTSLAIADMDMDGAPDVLIGLRRKTLDGTGTPSFAIAYNRHQAN